MLPGGIDPSADHFLKPFLLTDKLVGVDVSAHARVQADLESFPGERIVKVFHRAGSEIVRDVLFRGCPAFNEESRFDAAAQLAVSEEAEADLRQVVAKRA